jgi:hypothetical protein
MEIKVFKTFEITPDYWEKIVEEFNKSFNVQKDLTAFKEYYERTRLGYSYHALAFDKIGNLAGYNSLLPFLYHDSKDNDFIIGISGGTFVVKEYRSDIFIFSDMINSLLEVSAKDGVIATLGVPNENSFQYALKFLDSTLISYLHYYGLPVRIFNVLKIKSLNWLNFISAFAIEVILHLNLFISKVFIASEKDVRFELKTDDPFFKTRFGGNKYQKIRKDNVTAYYSVVSEKGIKTVYLLDFRQNGKRTYKSLITAVKIILNDEKPDLILFIGHLRLRQFLLFRVPRRLEPQPLPLTFNISTKKYNSYFPAMSVDNNWNFGLMNFDAR